MQYVLEGCVGLSQALLKPSQKNQLQYPLIIEHESYERNVYEFVEVFECFGGVVDVALIEVDVDQSLPGICGPFELHVGYVFLGEDGEEDDNRSEGGDLD